MTNRPAPIARPSGDPADEEPFPERPLPGTFRPGAAHVRAAVLLLALTILLTGLGYPALVTGFAQLVTPETANGSLLHAPNGTVVGSSLIAQNLSAPWLFWERPAPGDYGWINGAFSGAPTAYGPSDPALVNATRSYIAQYGFGTVNASVPFDLVSVSGSGVDPDLTPEAVLFQVPRIAAASNLSQATLLAFVNAHIIPPLAGFIGPAYVDVLQLDLALLPLEGRSL